MLPWKVYGLVESGCKFVYYVGIAQNVLRRINQHKSNPDSAAYKFLQQIMADNEPIEHCIFGEFRTKGGALHLETNLIAALPCTFNRTHRKKGREFWAPFQSVEWPEPKLDVPLFHC